MRKKIFILVLSVIISEHSIAQNICGFIRNSANSILPYATICADNNKYIAISDQFGHYELKNVGRGKHSISVSFLGYDTHHIDVEIAESQNLSLDITMEQQVYVLDEVLVTQDGIVNYIMSRVVNNPKLRDVLSHRKEDIAFRLESIGNLKQWTKSRRNLIRSGLAIIGLGKYFDCCVKHPNLVVHLSKTYEIDNKIGSMGTDAIMDSSSDSLTEREKAMIIDKFGKLSTDYYPIYYQKLNKLYNQYKKAYKKGEGDNVISYLGSYTENGRTIFKLKAKDVEIYIVDGCFQIRRILERTTNYKELAEFVEILPELYLPISVYHSSCLDMDTDQKWTWNESTVYTYSDLQR